MTCFVVQGCRGGSRNSKRRRDVTDAGLNYTTIQYGVHTSKLYQYTFLDQLNYSEIQEILEGIILIY